MNPRHAVPSSGRPSPPTILAALVLALAGGMVIGMVPIGRSRPAAAQPAAPMPSPTPLTPSGTQVLLPALGPFTDDPACGTSIHVQLVGDEPSKVVLLTWGAPGACPLDGSAGPLGVECSGWLAPGKTWDFPAGQIPAAARSGAIFSFSTRSVDDIIDLGGISIDDSVADLMCEELFFGVIGDAKDYQLFKQRFDTGGLFRGIPQDLAAGSPLVAWVERTCSGSGGLAGGLRSAYAGVPGTAFGAADPMDQRYDYGLAQVVALSGGRSSLVTVQNAGSACATVELRFSPDSPAPDPDCTSAPATCAPLTLVPGESIRLDVAQACGISDVSGALSLSSTAPLAIVVDSPGDSSSMAYSAYSTVSRADGALAAPLLVDTADGWRARVHVQNVDRRVAADARATVLDDQGESILTHDLALCPGGGAAWDIDLPAGSEIPFVGSVHVASQPVTTTDGLVVPMLVGVVNLTRDGAGGSADQAASYALTHAGGRVADSAPMTPGAPGDDVGALALPSLTKAVGSSEPSSVLVIANTVVVPGTTDFAVLLLDANGVVDHICRALGAGEAQAIDLASWPGLPADFMGSGVVSAIHWNHPVAGPGGALNAVGLAAVVIAPGLSGSGGFTGDVTAAEGIGLAQGQLTSFQGGSHPQGYLVLVPGCPGAARLVSPTPEPTRTPRPTATRKPTPVLTVRGFLPFAVTVRVLRR
jgi:hypothetical protein